MQVRVRLFGSVREDVGAKELALELPEGARVADLRQRLTERYPLLGRLGQRIRISVNRELVAEEAPLRDGDEVALLPPVSGGRGACTLSEHPLDPGEVMRRVAGGDVGGVVLFVGTVRERSRGRAIRHLEYEAYPEMALQEMERLVEEAQGRWPGVRVALAHRVGTLEVGEAAVVVAAAAPHRAEAFEAARFAIDTLKQRVPIWKKEVAVDGEYWVEEHA